MSRRTRMMSRTRVMSYLHERVMPPARRALDHRNLCTLERPASAIQITHVGHRTELGPDRALPPPQRANGPARERPRVGMAVHRSPLRRQGTPGGSREHAGSAEGAMHYTYLIVGGGMAGDSAVRGIREVDERGTIGMLCAEGHHPYNRPPLTKGLWKGQAEEQIWRDTPALGVEVHMRHRVVSLDTARRAVTDKRGETFTYDSLLLATGGAPKRLPFGGDEITYFRTFDDYRRLREQSARAGRFVVLGGGFIGSEIAAALALNGREVTMVFPEAGIGGRIFPAGLSGFLTGYYRDKGVDVRPGGGAAGMNRRGESAGPPPPAGGGGSG